MLFQADMGGQPAEEVRRIFWSQRPDVEASTRGFTEDIFRVASDRAREIDDLIRRHAQHWRLERMPAVDRNLMRAAVAEFLGFPRTPRPVVINEALEIARKFSSLESVQFINGVLDSIARDLDQAASRPSQPRSRKGTG